MTERRTTAESYAAAVKLGADCPQCRRKPHEKNHPIGMIFVGWGHGWVECNACEGTGLKTEETCDEQDA